MSLWEGFRRRIEFNETYTPQNAEVQHELEYVVAGSFYDLGGYVKNINVQIESKAKALKAVSDLRSQEFLNQRTKLLVTDFTLYNSYSDIFTVVIIPTQVRPNGMITSDAINYMNFKGQYYDF